MGGQEGVAVGSLEDWRVFWRSLGHSELLMESFLTNGGSHLMLILALEAFKSYGLLTDRRTDGRTDGRTFGLLELLSQLKRLSGVGMTILCMLHTLYYQQPQLQDSPHICRPSKKRKLEVKKNNDE